MASPPPVKRIRVLPPTSVGTVVCAPEAARLPAEIVEKIGMFLLENCASIPQFITAVWAAWHTCRYWRNVLHSSTFWARALSRLDMTIVDEFVRRRLTGRSDWQFWPYKTFAQLAPAIRRLDFSFENPRTAKVAANRLSDAAPKLTAFVFYVKGSRARAYADVAHSLETKVLRFLSHSPSLREVHVTLTRSLAMNEELRNLLASHSATLQILVLSDEFVKPFLTNARELLSSLNALTYFAFDAFRCTTVEVCSILEGLKRCPTLSVVLVSHFVCGKQCEPTERLFSNIFDRNVRVRVFEGAMPTL